MKTAEEKAKEKVSWNDVKEKYLKFHRMDKFTENMAIDIDFGYWLANEVMNEAYNQALIDRDNYAMEFAKWVESLSPSDRVSVWSKNGSNSGLFDMDMEQLLRKYKSKLKI